MRSISGISYPNRPPGPFPILKIDILKNDIVDSSSLSKTYRRSIFGGELLIFKEKFLALVYAPYTLISLLYMSLKNKMGMKILL